MDYQNNIFSVDLLNDYLLLSDLLKDLFSSLSISQAIIYCNSTRRVDDLQEAMQEDSFPVKKIHGKMSSEERKTTYAEFKAGGCRVLITSDLFARGIDVQQVSIVINFDIPRSEHTYLHRIGRSGRWGRKGVAINFQTKHDATRLKKFEEYYDTKIGRIGLMIGYDAVFPESARCLGLYGYILPFPCAA